MHIQLKKYRTIVPTLVLGLLAICGTPSPVAAETIVKGDIIIIHPWVEPSSGGDTFAHPMIANEGDHPLVLLRIETSAAEKIDILRNGKVVNNLLIKGGDLVAFDGPEAQIKLTTLTQPLVEGARFPARLVFTRNVNGDPENVNVDLEMVVGQDTLDYKEM